MDHGELEMGRRVVHREATVFGKERVWATTDTERSENRSPPSVSAAMVISRLEPNPPKPLPVSIPPSARKNVASAKRYTMTRKSPAERSESHSEAPSPAMIDGVSAVTTGTPAPMRSTTAKMRYGEKRKIRINGEVS